MFEKEILGILEEDRKDSFVSNDDNLRVDYSRLSSEKRARADQNKKAKVSQANPPRRARINFKLVVSDYVYMGESELAPGDSVTIGGQLVSFDKIEKLVKEWSKSGPNKDDIEQIGNLCYKLFVKFLKNSNNLDKFNEIATVASILVTIPEFVVRMRFEYNTKADDFVLAQFL